MRVLAAVAMMMVAAGCKSENPPAGGDLATTGGGDDLAMAGDLAGGGGGDMATTGGGAMMLTSTAFVEGGTLPIKQVWDQCNPQGNNKNPPLTVANVPAGTQSLAVLMFDTTVGFAHWAAWDLPATMTTIAEGSSKTASYPQAQNDFGTYGYDGPCPPSGPAHNYEITVYALDVATLGKGDHTAYADVKTALAGHIKGQATLNGKYAR